MRSFRCGEYVRDAHPQLFWLKEDAKAKGPPDNH
jgi:hypothetical protein